MAKTKERKVRSIIGGASVAKADDAGVKYLIKVLTGGIGATD